MNPPTGKKSLIFHILARLDTILSVLLRRKVVLDRKVTIQIVRFLITGLLAAGIDFGIYYLLFGIAGIHIAKAVSFISATAFTYIFNKFWTFDHKVMSWKEILRFVLFYIVSMGLNNIVNQEVFSLFHSKLGGFAAATAVCAVFNFFGLKLLVFKK